jgi:hypothetical protein
LSAACEEKKGTQPHGDRLSHAMGCGVPVPVQTGRAASRSLRGGEAF